MHGQQNIKNTGVSLWFQIQEWGPIIPVAFRAQHTPHITTWCSDALMWDFLQTKYRLYRLLNYPKKIKQSFSVEQKQWEVCQSSKRPMQFPVLKIYFLYEIYLGSWIWRKRHWLWLTTDTGSKRSFLSNACGRAAVGKSAKRLYIPDISRPDVTNDKC